MKKIVSLLLVIMMLCPAISGAAEELIEEWSFDMFYTNLSSDSSDMTLMEDNTDIYRELERRLVEAWTNLETEVDIEDLKIHKDDLPAMFALIYFENPLFYYVERGCTRHYNSQTGLVGYLTLRYLIDDKDEINKTWAEIDKATDEILLYVSPDMSDLGKIMAVHDYMVFNYTYELDDDGQTMDSMLDKKGVCTAYSEMFLHIMNILGIEATVVRSNDMGHIWNLVKLDNQWYHIDVTWDEPLEGRYVGVSHKYALLSTQAIMALGHYNFDMAGYTADSTLYDNAPWKACDGAIVSVDGTMYYIDGNNLVDETGKVIYEGLDGNDGGWNISKNSYVRNVVLAGTGELNSLLYFNSDDGIYAYNPKTEEITVVLDAYGVCGFYFDKNILRYAVLDTNTGYLVEGGTIKVSDVKYNEAGYDNQSLVQMIYNDSGSDVWMISKGEGYMMETVKNGEIKKAQFNNGTNQEVFIWKNSLEPLK